MARRTTTDPRLLTEVELEIMQRLWDEGQATVREVLAKLPPERQLAYTTVSTVLRILEQKGQVRSQKDGRTHIYMPVLQRGEHEALAVKHLVDRVFDGAPRELVAHLIEADELSADELKALRALVEEKLS